MTLPKDQINPNTNFTYPSERQYFDEVTSELGAQVVANPDNSGADYGIQYVRQVETINGTGSETGDGGGTPRRSSAE